MNIRKFLAFPFILIALPLLVFALIIRFGLDDAENIIDELQNNIEDLVDIEKQSQK